jgi:hypothetical protein
MQNNSQTFIYIYGNFNQIIDDGENPPFRTLIIIHKVNRFSKLSKNCLIVAEF